MICRWVTWILLCTKGFVSAGEDSARFVADFEMRHRLESWNGMNAVNYGNPDRMGDLKDLLVLQRVITGFVWYPKENFEVSAHLQDSRAFGWSLQHRKEPEAFYSPATGIFMNPQEQFFEIHDLYIKKEAIWLPGLSAQLGRQKIFYGDNRVFGPGNWGNTGRWTWDALRFSYRKESNYIDLFAGGTKTHHPQKTSIPFAKTQFWGGGMYAHYRWHELFIAEPFYALKTRGSGDKISEQQFLRHWAGTRVYNTNRNWHYDITAVRQFGHNNHTPIRAFGVVAKIGYQLKKLPAKPLLSIRESYASGGKANAGIDRTFEAVYGARDRYYGWMNICSWSNLDNREILLELFPVKGMWLEIKYNRYLIPEPTEATLLNDLKLKQGSRHLGDELNMLIRFRLTNQLQFTAVFGWFMPGDVQDINGHQPPNATFLGIQSLFTL